MAARQDGLLLIVDDDREFVAAAEHALGSAGYRTLTATNGSDAIALAEQDPPKVAVLEIQLPGLNGFEVGRYLRDLYGSKVAIAFVSGTRTGAVDISAGLLLGADDYLVKPCDPGVLVARVGALARRVDGGRSSVVSAPARLTTREREVLELLAEGQNQRQIATGLSISEKTVGVHIEHILEKLKVHSRAQAVAAAYRLDLLTRKATASVAP